MTKKKAQRPPPIDMEAFDKKAESMRAEFVRALNVFSSLARTVGEIVAKAIKGEPSLKKPLDGLISSLRKAESGEKLYEFLLGQGPLTESVFQMFVSGRMSGQISDLKKELAAVRRIEKRIVGKRKKRAAK